MSGFLDRMIRRLRLVWAWAFTGWVAPVVVAVALVLVAAGWLVPWGWFEPAALAVVAGTTTLIVVVAAFRPLSQMRAARAADRGLGTEDAFGAALEFTGLDGEFGTRIRQRAEDLAAVSSPTRAAPLPRLRGRWLLAAGLGASAMVLALLTNPQDEVRAERAHANEVAEELAEEVEEQAEELTDPATAEVAVGLQQLADELRSAQSFEEIESLFAEAERELSERPPDFAAERAAAEGLERSLATNPLPGQSAAATPSEQLAVTAAGLEGLTREEQRELAERLSQIAETQEAGDPETAEALREAAVQLAAGNMAGAEAALGEAAAAQRSNADRVAGQVAAGEAAEGLGQLAEQARQAQGEGRGQGSGEGSGEGQGSGSGEGQGSGSGTGGQGGSGSPGGQVGGASGGTGSGQGGAGTPGGTDQPDVDGDNSGDTIIDPEALQAGDPLDLGGSLSGDRPGENVGTVDGPTRSGGSQIPLSEVVGDYRDRATDAAQRSQLPPRQQELVGNYFDRLSQL